MKTTVIQKFLKKLGLCTYSMYTNEKKERTRCEFEMERLTKKITSLEKELENTKKALKIANQSANMATNLNKALISGEVKLPEKETKNVVEVETPQNTPKIQYRGVELDIQELENGKFAPVLSKCSKCGKTHTRKEDECATYEEAKILANKYTQHGFGVKITPCVECA